MTRIILALLALLTAALAALWLRRDFAWEEPVEPETDPYLWRVLAA